MSIWSDMATIVSATLSGDINFKVVQAYRSPAAWFVFGPVTIIGAVLFYYRERFAERLEARLGYSATKITHPIISILLFLGLSAAFLPPVSDLLNTVTGGLLATLVVFGPIILDPVRAHTRAHDRDLLLHRYGRDHLYRCNPAFRLFSAGALVNDHSTLAFHDHGVVWRNL